MPRLIILHLHPEEPTSGADFAGYLSNLTIEAFDVSFAHLGGQPIGTASFNPVPALSSIIQHVRMEGVPPGLEPQAVATAVIEVNAPWPEYTTSDVFLRVRRGSKRIAVNAINYNVAIRDVSSLPAPEAYASLAPVGLYLSLPPPGRELDPSDAYVELPKDGSPPNFADLKGAIEKVLAKDPGAGAPPELTQLTSAQCRHIAREIAWNRHLDPLPLPPRSLGEMYTAPVGGDADTARKTFEAELVRYRAVLDSRAEVLARYIFSLSAALACEKKSRDAGLAGFHFPVRPGATTPAGKIKDAKVVLEN